MEPDDRPVKAGRQGREGRRYQRLTRGRWMTSRAGFQICPHVPHRQYVVSEIDLLVVLTAAD